MSLQHTFGRLSDDTAEHDAPFQNIELRIGNRKVATVWIDDAPCREFNAEQETYARRLMACWNACEGLSTESLEILGTLDRSRVAVDTVRVQTIVQRDALQAALRMFVFPHQENDTHTDTQRQEIGRNVIAKVTGGAS